MFEPVKVRPSFNGGTCPYFTDGKLYVARPVGSGRVAEVNDDRGNIRVVSLVPGDKCPHLLKHWLQNYDRYEVARQEPVGTWEVVA